MNLKPYPALGFIALTGSLHVFRIVYLLRGWTGEMYSSLNFLCPSLSSKFWKGGLYS